MSAELEHYFVFDRSGNGDELFSSIKTAILDDFEVINKSFDLAPFEAEANKFLIKLAKSNRKKFSSIKPFSRHFGGELIRFLLAKNIIKIEKSCEPPLVKLAKNQKLKKELRRYHPEDKIHFTSNFARFWFYFCAPNIAKLQSGDGNSVLNIIKDGFNEYCSLAFELASIKLLAHHLNIDENSISSYWDRQNEIDIFARFGGFCVVGEAKYRGRKVCKNILNQLLTKCEHAKISPDIIALFSKSGFSNELLSLNDRRLILFDIDDFKEIL